MNVLMSIKSDFVKKIFSGEKKYEFRRAIFKRHDVDTIIIYATKPIGKIVGELKFTSILADSPKNIWEITKSQAGISEKFFFDYFKQKSTAYAIKIDKVIVYDKPIEPTDKFTDFTAPQSFFYIK